MQSKGLDFLRPIWAMIYCDEFQHGEFFFNKMEGLNLSESDVEVTYTRYINTKKPPLSQNSKPNDKTIYEAFDAFLTPGKKFQHIEKNSR